MNSAITQFLVAALLLVFAGSVASPVHGQAPVLEISIGDRQPLTVHIEPKVSRKNSIKRAMRRKNEERVPFALSGHAAITMSDDGNCLLVNHGFEPQNCLYLNAESELSQFWSLSGVGGSISPTGEHVLVGKRRQLELVDQKGNVKNLIEFSRQQSPTFCFGQSGKLYVLHPGENRTEGDVRFIHQPKTQQSAMQTMVSADESRLVTNHTAMHGPVFGKVSLMDVATGKITHEKSFYDHQAIHAEFSADGRKCIVGTTNANYLMKLPGWEIEKEFPGKAPAGFSTDGKSIWRVEGNKLSLHPIDSATETKSFDSHSRAMWRYGSNLENNQHSEKELQIDAVNGLAYQAKYPSDICDLNTGQQVGWTKQSTQSIVDGSNRLVYEQRSSNKTTTIEVLDFEGKLVRSFEWPNEDSFNGLLAVSPDGSEFIFRSGSLERLPDTNLFESTLDIHDSTTGKKTRTLGKFSISLHPVFSPDGSKLLFRQRSYGSVADPLLIVDYASGKVLHRINYSPWFCSHAQFSSDSKKLLLCGSINIGSWDRHRYWKGDSDTNPAARQEYDRLSRDWVAIRSHDLKAEAPPGEIRGMPASYFGGLSECKLSDDGKRVLVTRNGPNRDRSVNLWDIKTRTRTATIEGRLVAANDDFSLALIGKVNPEVSRYRVALWNLASNNEIHKVNPFPNAESDSKLKGAMSVVAVDWEQKQFVASGTGKVTAFFQINADGSTKIIAERRFDSSPGNKLIRPSGRGRSRQLIGHHHDGSVRFFDLQSLEELGRMYFFEDGAWVAIAAGGKFTGSKGVGERLSWRTNNQPAIHGDEAIAKFKLDSLAFE